MNQVPIEIFKSILKPEWSIEEPIWYNQTKNLGFLTVSKPLPKYGNQHILSYTHDRCSNSVNDIYVVDKNDLKLLKTKLLIMGFIGINISRKV